MNTPNHLIQYAAIAALCGSLAMGCGKEKPAPTPGTSQVDPGKSEPVKAGLDRGAEEKEGTPAGGEARKERAQPELADKETGGAAADAIKTVKVVPEPKKPTPAGAKVNKAEWLADFSRLTPGPAVALGEGALSHEVLKFLPNSTLAIGVFTNPREMLGKFGYADVLAYYGDRAKDAIVQTTAMTGHNLLDLDSYAKMGIDITKPAGVATLDVTHDSTIALFMTLTSAEAFNTALDGMVKRLDKDMTLNREAVGDATMISPPGNDKYTRFLVRGNTAFIVIGPSAKTAASVIATQGAATSLGQANEFVAAIKPLSTTKDGFGWLNVKYFGAAENGMWRERSKVPSYRRGEYVALDALLNPITGMGVGFEVGEQSVEMVGFLPADKGSLYLTLLKNGATAAAFRGTEKVPAFAMAGNVDFGAYMALAEMMMEADGESMAEVRTQMKAMMGLDLDKDILGAFSGQISAIGDADLSNVNDEDAIRKSINGALAYGLTAPDKFKSVMATLLGLMKSQMGDMFPGQIDTATGRLTMPLPTGHTLVAGIFGDQALASSSEVMANRIAKPDSTTFVDNITHPGLKAFVSQKDNASVGILSQAIAAGYFMVESSFDDEEPDPNQQKMVDTLATMGHTGFSMKVEANGLSGRLAQFPTKKIKDVVLSLTKMANTLADASSPYDDRPSRGKESIVVHAKEKAPVPKAPEPVKAP